MKCLKCFIFSGSDQQFPTAPCPLPMLDMNICSQDWLDIRHHFSPQLLHPPDCPSVPFPAPHPKLTPPNQLKCWHLLPLLLPPANAGHGHLLPRLWLTTSPPNPFIPLIVPATQPPIQNLLQQIRHDQIKDDPKTQREESILTNTKIQMLTQNQDDKSSKQHQDPTKTT